MADDSFDHSRTLFMHDDGAPVTFYMRPCRERKRLRKLIEHGGGIITSKTVTDSIKLAEKGSNVTADDYISSKYVTECVKENKLLDKTDFRYNKHNRDDGMEPASVIIRVDAKHIKGRTKYSLTDDRNIVKYLIENNLVSQIRGKKIWKDMEFYEVTSHSSESMRDHVLKTIIPNINSYDFPEHWKFRLTGGACGAVEKPSAESPNKLQKETETTTNEPSKAGCGETSCNSRVSLSTNSSSDIESNTDSSASPSKSPKKSLSQSKIILRRSPRKSPFLERIELAQKSKVNEVVNSVSSAIKELRNQQNSGECAKNGQSEDEASVSSRSSSPVKQTKRPSKKKEKDQKGDKNDDDGVMTTINILLDSVDECLKASMEKNKKEQSKNITTDSLDNKDDDDDVHNEKISDADKCNDLVIDDQQNGVGNDDEHTDVVNDDKDSDFMEEEEEDAEDELDKLLLKTAANQENPEKQKNSEDSDNSIHTKTGQKQFRKQQIVSKRKRKFSIEPQNSNDELKDDDTEDDIDKELKRATPAKLLKENNHRRDEPGCEKCKHKQPQNIKKIIKSKYSFVRSDSRSPECRVDGAERHSSYKTENDRDSDDITDSDKDSLSDKSQHKEDSSSNPRTIQMNGKKRKLYTSNSSSVSRHSVKPHFKRKTVTTSYSSDSEDEFDEEYLEIDCNTIKAVASQFKLTVKEAIYCAYINSGNIPDTVHWIMNGVDTAGYPAWSHIDDRILLGDNKEEKDRLKKILGANRVKKRINFLKKQK